MQAPPYTTLLDRGRLLAANESGELWEFAGSFYRVSDAFDPVTLSYDWIVYYAGRAVARAG
jgi:hypothetical protein